MKNGFIVTDNIAQSSKQKISKLIRLIKNLPFSVKDSKGKFPALNVYQRRHCATKRCMARDYGFQIDGNDFVFNNNYSFVLDIPQKEFRKRTGSSGYLDKEIVFYKNYAFLLVTPDNYQVRI